MSELIVRHAIIGIVTEMSDHVLKLLLKWIIKGTLLGILSAFLQAHVPNQNFTKVKDKTLADKSQLLHHAYLFLRLLY